MITVTTDCVTKRLHFRGPYRGLVLALLVACLGLAWPGVTKADGLTSPILQPPASIRGQPLRLPTSGRLGVLNLPAASVNAGDVLRQQRSEEARSRAKPYLRLAGSGFYYAADFDVRYRKAKGAWQDANPGRIPALVDLTDMAWQAYSAPRGQAVERLLPRWHMNEKPAPWVIRPKVLLSNESPTASELNLVVYSRVDVLKGQWLVNPTTMLADFDHLLASAQWQPLLEEETLIPVLPANQQRLLDLPPVEVFKLFSQQSHQWPVMLKLSIALTPNNAADVKDQAGFVMTLPLVPDHMALPLYLY
jgi:hypothetical protein